MPAELARRFERPSPTYEARVLPTGTPQHNLWRWRGELHSRIICFAGRRLAVLATPPQPLERSTGIAPVLPDWRSGVLLLYELRRSEQRESNSRHRVGNPRHQPLYHARSSKTLAGVTGFEPAKTGFGDQRPSHRVLTPVAVATGVETVPPHKQYRLPPPGPLNTITF